MGTKKSGGRRWHGPNIFVKWLCTWTMTLQESKYVGQRFFNTEIEESFTVVGVDSQFFYLQYDDGVAWDEAVSPGQFPSLMAEIVDVSEAGLEDSKYVPLGSGPTLDQACMENEHTLTPSPDFIWDEEPSPGKMDVYASIARCKKCGLSFNTILEFLGQWIEYAWWCDDCGEYSEDAVYYRERKYCPDCVPE